MQKQQEKESKKYGNTLNLSSDESDDREIVRTDESIYLATGTLTSNLAKAKVESEKNKVETSKIDYSWKISVQKHRKKRQAWDISIILIALYSVLVIPIRISINKTLWDPVYDFIDIITWLIYVFDVFVNMRTTYIDSFGLEVVEGKQIMKKYIYSFRFIVDILSLLNLPSMFISFASPNTQVVLNILGLLKLSRYFRAQSLIVESRLQKEQKSLASCGFYFILMLIYLHMIGCMFFFFCLGTYEKSNFRLSIADELGLHAEVDGKDVFIFPEFEVKWRKAYENV